MKSPYKRIPKTVDTELEWSDGLKFVSNTGSHNQLVLDASLDHGGHNQGVRPMEAVLSALGGSTGMDLITILKNKKLKIDGLKIILHGERAPAHPHIFKKVTMEYIIWGSDISGEDVQLALDVSLKKYCSVAAMLAKSCKINYKWRIYKKGRGQK